MISDAMDYTEYINTVSMCYANFLYIFIKNFIVNFEY